MGPVLCFTVCSVMLCNMGTVYKVPFVLNRLLGVALFHLRVHHVTVVLIVKSKYLLHIRRFLGTEELFRSLLLTALLLACLLCHNYIFNIVKMLVILLFNKCEPRIKELVHWNLQVVFLWWTLR